MAYKPLPIGIDDFEKLISKGYYYVDKTGMIAELLEEESTAVTLITRPRRFGKTLGMSMLASFFDIQRDSTALFEGLEISGNGELCGKWMNQYPTIFLSFKDVDGLTFQSAYDMLSAAVTDLYKKHLYLLDSGKVKIIKTPTVLDELIDSVLLKFNKRYPRQTILLDIPDEIVIIPMDALLIEQVIINILENAVQHAVGMTSLWLRVFVIGGKAIFEIQDDGCGMDAEFVKRVTDPFTTTRTTRKVGMGIPLFKMAAEMADGTFSITSEKGVCTTVTATFVLDHIDRAPLGDLADTVVTLIGGECRSDFVFDVRVNGKGFVFDTRELKAELDGVPVGEPEVLVFVRDMIKENLIDIGGEKL